MIDAREIIGGLRGSGIALRAVAGTVRYFPADALMGDEVPGLARFRDALLAALAEEQSWREAAMRPRLPARGAIPLLMAVDGPHPLGHCASCGLNLVPRERYRCDPCVKAAWAVLTEAASARDTT